MAKLSPKEYEKLGQQMASIITTLNPNKKALWRTTFIKGAISGLGGVVGATVGIALLLWILSFFGQVPLVGHFIENIRTSLQNHPR